MNRDNQGKCTKNATKLQVLDPIATLPEKNKMLDNGAFSPSDIPSIARVYNKLGFNVVPLHGKKPLIEWEHLQEKPVNFDCKLFQIWNCTGLGHIAGNASHLIALDFDPHTGACIDFSLIQAALDKLDLPKNYPWLVRTGKGFHVWIDCAALAGSTKIHKPAPGKGPKELKQIEVRGKGNTVLPYSAHPKGGTYTFAAGTMPTAPPSKVTADAVAKMIAAIAPGKALATAPVDQLTQAALATAPGDHTQAALVVRYCMELASKRGYAFTDGSRTEFLTFVCPLLSRWGVDLPDQIAHLNDALGLSNFPEHVERVQALFTTNRRIFKTDRCNLPKRYFPNQERPQVATQPQPKKPQFDTQQIEHVSDMHMRIYLQKGQSLDNFAEEIHAFCGKHTRVLLKSGTGTGKTYTAVNTLGMRLFAESKGYTVANLQGDIDNIKDSDIQEMYTKSCMIVPYRSIAQQTAQTYNVPCVMGGTSDDEKHKAKTSIFAVSTYDSFPRIAQYFDVVFIDESHELDGQFNFRAATMNAVFALIPSMKKAILMSATPNLMLLDLGFAYIEVIQEREAIPVHPRYVTQKGKKSPGHIVMHHLQSSKADVNIFKINSKDEIEATKTALIKEGYAPEQIVLLYNSESGEPNSSYNELMETSKFGESVKVVLCTKIVEAGVNIHNPGKAVDMVTIETSAEKRKGSFLCTKSHVQFFARMRTYKALNCYIYHTGKIGQTIPQESEREFFQLIKGNAERNAHYLNKSPNANNGLFSVDSIFDTINQDIIYDRQEGKYKANVLSALSKSIKIKVQSTDIQTFYAELIELAQYFEIQSAQEAEYTENQTIELSKAETKAIRAVAEAEIAYIIENGNENGNIDTVLEIAYHKTSDIKLKKLIHRHLKNKLTFSSSDMSQAAIDLYNEKIEIFRDNFTKVVLPVARWYVDLKNLQIDEPGILANIFADGEIKGTKRLRNFAEYNAFYKQSSTLFLIRMAQYVASHTENGELSQKDAWDIIGKKQARTLTILAGIQGLFNEGDVLTKKVAEAKVNEYLKREKISTHKTTPWLLLTSFYRMELQNNRREYAISSLEWTEFFRQNGCNFEHIDKNIRQALADVLKAKEATAQLEATPF